MKQIRIGKDITVRWPILTNGEVIPLGDRNLTMTVQSPVHQEKQIDFQRDGNVAVFVVPGMEQTETGTYSFTLWENKGRTGQTVVDCCGAFRLVSKTCLEKGADDRLTTESIELTASILELGVKGTDGQSAYQSAVEGGYGGDKASFYRALGDQQVYQTVPGSDITLDVTGGHTYLCGELTALTLSTVADSPREAIIRFQSGAVAPTLTLPEGLSVTGYPVPAANARYEINIASQEAVITRFDQ